MTDKHDLAGHYVLKAISAENFPKSIALKIEAMLRLAGMTLADLGKPDARIPLSLIEGLLLANRKSPALIAIESASAVQLTSQGALSVLLMTANTVREAVLLTARFVPLLVTGLELHLEEDDRRGYLFITPHTGYPAINQVIVFYVATAIRRLATLAVGGMPNATMQVATAMPEGLKEHPLFEPSHWQFNAPLNCFLMEKSFLDQSGYFVDPTAHAIAQESCEHMLAEMNLQPSIVTTVKQMIASAATPPSQEAVAEALHYSRNTLKRRLAKSGLTFNALIQSYKQEQAVKLLCGTHMSLERIAERLGYADPTNFCHAFKRWTGSSPAAYRRQMS